MNKNSKYPSLVGKPKSDWPPHLVAEEANSILNKTGKKFFCLNAQPCKHFNEEKQGLCAVCYKKDKYEAKT